MLLLSAKGREHFKALNDTLNRVDFTEEDASCEGFSGRLCFKVINSSDYAPVNLV